MFGDQGHVHLRVEEASGSFDNADRLVVYGDSVEGVLGVLQNGNELETQVLGVHLRGEAVGGRLLLASGDFQRVALGRQVAQDLGLRRSVLQQGSADNGQDNGLRLVILDRQAGLGRVAVDELHAEDLGLGEADGGGDLEVGRLGLLDDFLYAFDLCGL